MSRLMARLLFHSDWPLRMIFWKKAHELVGGLAWRFARPSGPERGITLRIDRTHPLWRLNDWVASRWTAWWIQRSLDR